MNATITDTDVTATIAASVGARPENLVLGAGSAEILRSTVRAFTSTSRHLVTAAPSYASPTGVAERIGTEVRAIPVDSELRLDLDAMADAAKGAGVIFFCNPNNPTATVHGKDAVVGFIDRVHAISPDTVILMDEAYHDYVTDDAHRTAIPLALERENVIVSRTFSKAYGMAGLRIGYGLGRESTVEKLRGFRLTFNTNVLVMAAAMASLGDPDYIPNERERNRKAREYTLEFFEKADIPASDSQTNFILVELGYPAKTFRDACADKGVHVGRDFPPLEKTHCRISIGTMAEMTKATEVFGQVLKEVG
jgi:histidinol-phosphate aminotransferase